MTQSSPDPNQPYLPGLEPPQEPIRRGGFTSTSAEDLLVKILQDIQRVLENMDKSLEEIVVLLESADDGGYRR